MELQLSRNRVPCSEVKGQKSKVQAGGQDAKARGASAELDLDFRRADGDSVEEWARSRDWPAELLTLTLTGAGLYMYSGFAI